MSATTTNLDALAEYTMGPQPHVWVFKVTLDSYCGIIWVGHPLDRINVGYGHHWLHLPLQATVVVVVVLVLMVGALVIREIRKK